MIETLCFCGCAVRAAESAAGTSVRCRACKSDVRIVSAEPIADGAGLGDFDARFIIEAGPTGVGETIALGGVSDIQMGKAPTSNVLLAGHSVSFAYRCQIVASL